MRRRPDEIPEYQSVLADQMKAFIQEKRGHGYRYRKEAGILERLDRMLCDLRCSALAFDRQTVERWVRKDKHQCPRTHQARATVARQFALFLRRQNIDAFVLDRYSSPINRNVFSPYIFTHDQIRCLFRVVDLLPPHHRGPLRHLIMPELFRVLYGCGLRVSEALNLRVTDVDLDQGILVIRQGKFRKDRLVPLASDLAARLGTYHERLGPRLPESVFFPAPDGGPYGSGSIYCIFRGLLSVCQIPHGGRNRGPRVHDLRSTFAVHRLARWYREGADLGHKLPILSAYMGHQCISGTQHYLRLTLDLFGDLTDRLDQVFGSIIPVEAKP